MTNGEKIINDFPYIEIKDQNKVFTTIQIDTTGIGIPIIVYTEWWNKWWNAEYKEPTTKNDLALIHTEGLDKGIRCAMCTNSIKSDRGCDGNCVVNNAMYKEVMDVIENHIADTDKMIEPTAKNNLGVDCVSRKEVEKLVYRFLQKGTDENIAFYEHFLDLPSVTPQPCEDAVSRKDVHDMLENLPITVEDKWFNWLQKACMRLADLPSVTTQEPRCKNCKWWKDSDGEYRRGCGAESQCPINRREVFEGNGYCFLFEPQKSEDKE